MSTSESLKGVNKINSNKKERLKSLGWEVGETSDFLELTTAEMTFIDLKIALSKRLKALRISQNSKFKN